MPTFFFHVYDDHVCHDDDGLELPDVGAAHREAERSARSLACEQITKGRLNLRHRIEVEDEHRRLVLTLPFKNAFIVEG
jgi:hypothetical protein